MNDNMKMVLIFCVMMGIYLIVFIANFNRYRQLSKDTSKMTITNINLTLKRSIVLYTVNTILISAAYALVKIDPNRRFSKHFITLFGILFIVQLVFLIQTLRWGIVVKDDNITIARTIGKKIKFKFSDIKAVQILAVDALITLKSGKHISVYGKSNGFELLCQRLKGMNLIN